MRVSHFKQTIVQNEDLHVKASLLDQKCHHNIVRFVQEYYSSCTQVKSQVPTIQR